MPEVVCNTSPIQYLHQLGQLHLLPALVGQVIIPPAVVAELDRGRDLGVDLPDTAVLTWIVVRHPIHTPALPQANDLGPGESEVLALAMEADDAVAILDDGLARQVAQRLGIPIRGTLGVLLDAKQAGLISQVRPLLDELQALQFRLAPATREAVLRLAGENA